jgi:cytosine/uracil/thiamine/allantoin permease
MKVALLRLIRLLPALWCGILICVATLATPAPFAELARDDAGRVVRHIFAREAPMSLIFGAIMLIWARRKAFAAAIRGAGSMFTLNMLLPLGALVCTVVGYYVMQPMMEQARMGVPTALSFGQLHAISFGCFAAKLLLVFALAWRLNVPIVQSPRP